MDDIARELLKMAREMVGAENDDVWRMSKSELRKELK